MWYFVDFVVGKGWPLNFHFVFDLLGVGGVALVGVVLLLPKSIELKRIKKEKIVVDRTNDQQRLAFVDVESNNDDARDQPGGLERTQQN